MARRRDGRGVVSMVWVEVECKSQDLEPELFSPFQL